MAGLAPYVALLRGVNVGGRNRLPMSELRVLASDLGLVEPRTLLQSGNLVFGAPVEAEAGRLAVHLREALEVRLGVAVPVIVRAASELGRIIAANPYPAAAAADPDHLLAVFFDRPADPAGVDALRLAARGGEEIAVQGREAFIHYASGVAGSRLTAALIDRRLGVVGTARNWNTVRALAVLAESLPRTFEGGREPD